MSTDAGSSDEPQAFPYDLSEEEWNAMVSDKTSPERRQYYFEEFRERIYHFWFKKSGGPPRTNVGSKSNEFRVDEDLE